MCSEKERYSRNQNNGLFRIENAVQNVQGELEDAATRVYVLITSPYNIETPPEKADMPESTAYFEAAESAAY